jgi:hypothetical protein
MRGRQTLEHSTGFSPTVFNETMETAKLQACIKSTVRGTSRHPAQEDPEAKFDKDGPSIDPHRISDTTLSGTVRTG